MTKKIFALTLCLLITLSMVLTACTPEETETPETAAPETSTPTPTEVTGGGDWWDKFGEPQYGGEIIFCVTDLNASDFDPANLMIRSPYGYWTESLFIMNWAEDRAVCEYKTGYIADQFWTTLLAESWEQTDAQTITVKLQEGIHFQDKEPVNGRELVAQDVQYTFDRILGTGSGFTEPNPFFVNMLAQLDRVVALDDYTVEFRLKAPTATGTSLIIQAANQVGVVAQEWIEQGDLSSVDYVCGTGPWIATEYTKNVSITCEKNPNYWGFDPRHPENQVPYADTIKEVAIPDGATALSAVRTGKVDILPSGILSWQQAESLAETNPDIQQTTNPKNGFTLELRCDNEPFTDINVRKALQMAINREEIAASYYGGRVDGIPCGVASQEAFVGWVTPYEDWPQELKDEYSYNPDKSRELLAAAGYPDGFDTKCIASTTTNSDTTLLEIIKSQFADIGVEMEITTMDSATYRSYGAAMKHDQMIMSVNLGMFFVPSDIIRWRESTNTRDNWTANNDAYYDSLVEKFNTAATMDEAKAIFNEADLYSLQQHWAVALFPLSNPVAWQPYIVGYSGEFTASGSERGFYGARIWVDQALKDSMVD